ncbi:MAG: sugar ABC transporter permease, partial [Dactylosporangium sp.]|nr:sugar ABC transporter permease [Dactylosporangium sp.]
PPPAPGASQAAARVVGFVLLVPALMALLWSYVIPTITTIVKSFQRDTPFSEPEGVGTKNYETAFSNGLAGDLGFALLLALVPVLVALLVAPLLAMAAHHSGRVARLITRGLLAAPLVCYAPTAIAAAWRADRLDPGDRAGDAAAGTVVTVAGWVFLGFVVAVAATLYLSALRGRRPVPALLTVGAVLALGIVALAVQSYAVPVATAAMVNQDTATPLVDVFNFGFRNAQLGQGATVSTLLLLVLGLLGLAATAILLATRARVEFGGWRDRPDAATTAPARGRPLPLVLLVVLLAAGFAGLGYALTPWFGSFTGGKPLPGDVSSGQILLNTWGAPLISSAVGVGLAALAGFGIGALRPLGRHSELLLLLFAPWLFVGVGPLAIAGYERARDLEQVDSFLGLIPPGWLCIPALVVFTLLFRGAHHQATTREDGRADLAGAAIAALPMVVAAGLLSWLVSAQGLFWPQLVAISPDHRTAPLLIVLDQGLRGQSGHSAASGLSLPIPLLVLFALLFVALQVLYLDRLSVRVGRRS